ncbi:reverse transcriptase domain-containing protein [Tanacetum coccineum]
MPNNVKTYDGIGDLEDHVKIFQAAAQVEHWAMPMWCHMFNSTLIGTARVWFDELPPASINGYKDLKAAFLAYFMQQKKYVKDLVEIYNIRQRDGETVEDFKERFKVETRRMMGALECMRIFPSTVPNVHFLGLSFILIFRNVRNVSSISLSISVSV